jgi:hypothetical protein
MVTFLITSVLVLSFLAIAIYYWQKPANKTQSIEPPPPPSSLFPEAPSISELLPPVRDQESSLLIRANRGEPEVLIDANGRDIYEEVLNALISHSEVATIGSFVAKHNLPANRELAEAMFPFWEASPNRQTTTQMLHVAALADSAEVYELAVRRVLSVWQEGKLRDVSELELQALFNSEFWLLSSAARSSGAGFILKRTLSSARRELEGINNYPFNYTVEY